MNTLGGFLLVFVVLNVFGKNCKVLGFKAYCDRSLSSQISQYNLDDKQRYCGTHLTRTLCYFCAQYNSPTGRPRFKRNIVKECCESQCSLSYLVENYCAEVDNAALEMLQLFIEKRTFLKEQKEKNSEIEKEELRSDQTETDLEHLTNGRTDSKTNKIKKRKRKHLRKRRERKCTCPKERDNRNRKPEISEEKKNLLLNRVVPSSRLGLIGHHLHLRPHIVFK